MRTVLQPQCCEDGAAASALRGQCYSLGAARTALQPDRGPHCPRRRQRRTLHAMRLLRVWPLRASRRPDPVSGHELGGLPVGGSSDPGGMEGAFACQGAGDRPLCLPAFSSRDRSYRGLSICVSRAPRIQARWMGGCPRIPVSGEKRPAPPQPPAFQGLWRGSGRFSAPRIQGFVDAAVVCGEKV